MSVFYGTSIYVIWNKLSERLLGFYDKRYIVGVKDEQID